MTRQDTLPLRVIELAYRQREGTILPEEMDWLRTWLFASADRRAVYLDLATLFASLDWELAVFGTGELQSISPQQGVRTHNSKVVSMPLLVSARLPSWQLIWSTALVSLLIYSSFALISWNLRATESRPRHSPHEVRVVDFPTVRDQDELSLANAALVRVAEPILFDHGTRHFIFENGVTISLVGPVDARLEAPDRLLLSRGMMSAIVPAKSRGFAVETKTARIVDLGTEFEVLAENDNETLVQVFDGAVDIEPNGAVAEGSQPSRTNANEARRIVADTIGQLARVTSTEFSARRVSRPASYSGNSHEIIGSFRRDFRSFTESSAAADGNKPFPDRWQFLWNSKGPIGQPHNYEPLSWYTPLHAFIPASVPPPENLTTPVVGPARFARIHAHGGHPGSGIQESQTCDRFVIASYRVPQQGSYAITKSFVCCYDKRSEVPQPEKTSGVEVLVFLENEAEPRTSVVAPVGGAEVSFDVVLGNLRTGTLIYIAAGPRSSEVNDSFDWDFSLVRLK